MKYLLLKTSLAYETSVLSTSPSYMYFGSITVGTPTAAAPQMQSA